MRHRETRLGRGGHGVSNNVGRFIGDSVRVSHSAKWWSSGIPQFNIVNFDCQIFDVNKGF